MIKSLKWVVFAASLAILVVSQTHAASFINGASISYAHSNNTDPIDGEDYLNGARVALYWDWPTWFHGGPFQLTGRWDFSAAWWNVTRGKYTNTFTFAAIPVVRVMVNGELYHPYFLPYAEVGSGPAIHTRRIIGDRNQGGIYAFENMFGVGVTFGDRRQFDLSYHYMHLSNANIDPPNEGLNVQMLLSLAYRWA